MIHDINDMVGGRIRARRLEKGMTIEQLAAEVGVPDTSLTDYETGRESVRVSTLFRICRALSAPLSFFFDGHQRAMDTMLRPEPTSMRRNGASGFEVDYQKLWLLNSFAKISDPDVRIRALCLIDQISTASHVPEGARQEH